MAPTLQLSLMLQARQPHDLDQLAEAVSDPHRAAYGQYLNREQLSQTIGLDQAERDAIARWLQAYGMDPLPSPALADQELVFRTTITQLTAALGATITQHLLSPRAVPMAQITAALPRSLAGYIHTIRVVPDSHPDRQAAYWQLDSVPLPLVEDSVAMGQPHQPRPAGLKGLDPDAIRRGYDLPVTLTGQDETIAVMVLGGVPESDDLLQFWHTFGITPPQVYGVEVTPLGARSHHPLYRWETTMTVQWLGAIAPQARLVLYFIDPGRVADPWSSFLLAVLSDQRFQPTIACITWSAPERQYYRANGMGCVGGLLDQCAALGITVLTASGDWGIFEGMPRHPVQGERVMDTAWPQGAFPAVAERVLTVGGTQVTTLHPWQEQAWSAPISSRLRRDLKLEHMAGGGGFSVYGRIPPWQQPVLQTHYDRTGNCPAVVPYGRGFPDVALAAWGPAQDADCPARAGMAYWGFMAEWRNDAGGTSLAAPIWAAIIAALNQARRARGLPRLGFFNPLLYQLKATGRGGLCSITRGHTDIALRVISREQRAELQWLPGFKADASLWNPAVGLGVPDVSELIKSCLLPDFP